MRKRTISNSPGASAFFCAAWLFLPVLLTGCGITTGTEEEDPLRAVIFYKSDTWVQDINVMQQIAESIERNLEDCPEVALSCYGIQDSSISDVVQTAVDMETDVLIYYSLSSEEALEAYGELQEAGIRLILVDGDVAESGRYAYIGTDNYQAGVQACEQITDSCGQEASVAILMPVLDTSLCSVKARVEGFEAAAEECGLEIRARCETSYDSLLAIAAIEELLDTWPDISVLYCTEAVSGQAAAEVVRERGRKEDILVITYDTNDNIQANLADSSIDVTFIQNTDDTGAAVADALRELAGERDRESGEDILFLCTPVTTAEGSAADETEK